jgi:SDR family mycofactocin-dependent oxidoreductase
MGKLDGKVAFISGGARGQGRSHAVRLAEEGADIITFDICAQIEGVSYEMSNPDDLEITRKEVEALGRRIVAEQADARDVDAVRKVFEKGAAEIGPVDIVVANAGIGIGGPEGPDRDWYDVIDVNLTGVWNTVRVVIPSLLERDQGGSIILTSSTGGMMGVGNNDPGMLAYTAAKHGVVGLMRAWANYLAPHYIRVNAVAPTAVNTPMASNPQMQAALEADPALASAWMNPIPVMWVEARDISNTVAFLASDDARYVSGTVVPVDAGLLNKA